MSIIIVAIADSHTTGLAGLPPALRQALAQADIIIHAGDHTEMSLLQELQELAQVVAVAGNMDSSFLKLQLPHRQLFTVDTRTIGVTHGSGAPSGIERRVRATFPEKPDLIVFGHSHMPFRGIVDGVLMVNPGPAGNGYAQISIGTKITVRLIPL